MIITLLQAAALAAPVSTSGTVTLAVIGTVGAGGLGKLVQMWLKYKKESKADAGADGVAFRANLQDRVVELEDKVDLLQDRIEEMIKIYSERILVLATENARLQSELEASHKEIERLLSDLEDYGE